MSKVIPWAYEFGRKLKRLPWLEWLLGGLLALVLIYLFGCSHVVQPDDIVSPDDLESIAEAYCLAHPELNCGKVYACQTPSDNPIGLIELCIPQPDATNPLKPTLEQAEAEFGACDLSPSPRFDKGNLCWWCCGPTCGPGSNAYSGSYCPAPPAMPDAGVVDPVPPAHP